jgi:hypothetical protein
VTRTYSVESKASIVSKSAVGLVFGSVWIWPGTSFNLIFLALFAVCCWMGIYMLRNRISSVTVNDNGEIVLHYVFWSEKFRIGAIQDIEWSEGGV